MKWTLTASLVILVVHMFQGMLEYPAMVTATAALLKAAALKAVAALLKAAATFGGDGRHSTAARDRFDPRCNVTDSDQEDSNQEDQDRVSHSRSRDHVDADDASL